MASGSARCTVTSRRERRCSRPCFAPSFDELTAKAGKLETSSSPDDALVSWLHEAVAVAPNDRGVVASMMAAIADPNSALDASCLTMRAAGTRLLARAQAEGVARTDIDGADLFALVGAAYCSVAPRATVAFATRRSSRRCYRATVTNRASVDVKEERRPRGARGQATWPHDSATGGSVSREGSITSPPSSG
jgi:hypothetical protein